MTAAKMTGICVLETEHKNDADIQRLFATILLQWEHIERFSFESNVNVVFDHN